MRNENWSMAGWTMFTLTIVGVVFVSLVILFGKVPRTEPTITLVSKDWECIAWKATSVASAETECTIYWRVN